MNGLQSLPDFARSPSLDRSSNTGLSFADRGFVKIGILCRGSFQAYPFQALRNMEDGRIEFLRLQVESHQVESLLKCLEGIDVESLTVRNVHETRFGTDRRTEDHFDVVGLAQLEIFVREECRATILRRIHAMRKPLDAEVTCQCGRMCSGGSSTGLERGLIRLDAQGLTNAGESFI